MVLWRGLPTSSLALAMASSTVCTQLQPTTWSIPMAALPVAVSSGVACDMPPSCQEAPPHMGPLKQGRLEMEQLSQVARKRDQQDNARYTMGAYSI